MQPAARSTAHIQHIEPLEWRKQRRKMALLQSKQRIRLLILEMGLTGKTDFKDGRFTSLNLSTGQRKRLALIIAILEDREIYVFDEWAADQDVEFREFFYQKILPDLKEAGKAVIAVTHDDRYWGLADQIVKLEAGRILFAGAGSDFPGYRGNPVSEL